MVVGDRCGTTSLQNLFHRLAGGEAGGQFQIKGASTHGLNQEQTSQRWSDAYHVGSGALRWR